MTGLTTFHSFPRLPQELQDKIWDNFIDDPCHFEAIDIKPKPSTRDEQILAFFTETPRIPPLLKTSRAARHSCLKKYWELPTTSGKTYFDPEIDTIYFGYGCRDGAAAMKWLTENTYVRYVEFRIMIWPVWSHRWGQPFFHALRQHANLKEITLVAETRDIHKGIFEMIDEKLTGCRIGKVPELKYAFRKNTEDVAARGVRRRLKKPARKGSGMLASDGMSVRGCS